MADNRAVIMIPIGEDVEPVDLGAEEVAAGNTIQNAQSFQADWAVDPNYGDLYPKGEPGKDSGLGIFAKPVRHLGIGDPTDADGRGFEGLVASRDPSVGGGLTVIGLRDVDPQNPPPLPLAGNAFLELNGSAVLISTGGLWLELASPIDKDHELIIGPSIQDASGRNFSPVLVGPEKVYTHFDEVTDNRDLDVLDLGEVLIASLTLTNAYAADISTFSFSVLVENLASRITVFDVVIKLDSVEVVRYSRSVTGGQLTISDTDPIENALTAGQVVTMFVDAVGTHPQSEGWVRGSVQASRMRVQQG